MILVDGCETHPDGEPAAEHGVPASIAVLVPGEADEAVDGVDTLEESFSGHVREMLAERIPGSVAVAQQLPDGDVALTGDQGPQGRGLLCEVKDPAGVGLAVASGRPPRRAVAGAGRP